MLTNNYLFYIGGDIMLENIKKEVKTNLDIKAPFEECLNSFSKEELLQKLMTYAPNIKDYFKFKSKRDIISYIVENTERIVSKQMIALDDNCYDTLKELNKSLEDYSIEENNIMSIKKLSDNTILILLYLDTDSDKLKIYIYPSIKNYIDQIL